MAGGLGGGLVLALLVGRRGRGGQQAIRGLGGPDRCPRARAWPADAGGGVGWLEGWSVNALCCRPLLCDFT